MNIKSHVGRRHCLAPRLAAGGSALPIARGVRYLVPAVLLNIALGSVGTAQTDSAPGSENPHFVSGLAAADPDFPGLANLCSMPAGQRGAPPGPPNNAQAEDQDERRLPSGPPATRVFDNLIFLGHERVSAWAVETSDGLILIDALNNPEEAEFFIENGLASLGLDPADIRIMLISHGHGDHYAGGRYLQEKYGMEVVMSAVDWQMLSSGDTGFNVAGWAENIPDVDRTVHDERDAIVLGDTTLELVVTPGHTMGTITTIITVKDGDNTHLAALWGGTGFNFEPNTWQFLAYATSAERMRAEVLERGMEVFLSNHVRRDQSDRRIELLEERRPGDAHPFLFTPERLARGFQVFRDCALGRATMQL